MAVASEKERINIRERLQEIIALSVWWTKENEKILDRPGDLTFSNGYQAGLKAMNRVIGKDIQALIDDLGEED